MAKRNKTQVKALPISGDNPSKDAIIGAIGKLHNNRKLLFQILDMFPIPIEIFEPKGTMIFINRAGIELNNVQDTGLVIGKYNLLTDPVCNDQLGLREGIQRAFRGESTSFSDFIPPVQDLVDRGVAAEKPFEKAFMDIFTYPAWNGEELAFIVCVFIVKNLYQGRPDVVKVKEYLDKHWEDRFDPQTLAKLVSMSISQLYKLFKQHTGMTPGDYYRKCKVDRIKEKLIDKSLSIKEAFAACGENSRGTYARVFKDITGVSPSQFRSDN